MLQLRTFKLLCGTAAAVGASISLVGCQTTQPNQSYTWMDCAPEGQVCRTGGPTQVRYGARGHYAYRHTQGPIWCGNDTFGDPAPGWPKHCQVQAYVGGSPSATVNRSPLPQQPNNWEHCAREEGVCHAPHGATVRFGANERYAYTRANGPLLCSVRAFGDPAYGISKSCDYRVSGR